MNDARSSNRGLISDLIQSAARSFIIRAIGIASTYLFSIFIIREYQIESWGKITLLFSIIQVAALVIRVGMDKETMLKFSSESPSAISYYSKAFRQIALHSVAAILCALTYFSFSGTAIFREWNLFYICIGASAMSVLMLHSEMLRGLKKVGWYSFFEKGGIFTITALFALISFFTFPSAEFNLFYLVLAIALLCLLAIYISRNAIQKLPNNIRSRELHLESPLKLGYPLMLSGAGFMIMNWSDLFIIDAYHQEGAVGLFNICSRIASLSAFALLAVNTANGPKISELFQKQELKKLEKYIQHSNKITASISLLVGVVIFIFPHVILDVFGINTQDNAVVNCLLILVVGEVINASCGSIGLLLQATGYRKQFQRIVFISTLMSIVLGLLFIPKYGIIGGAIANAGATAIWNISAFLYARRKLNIGLFISKL
jgi:O-antigen/teichoic acid export membrane protein